MLSGESMYVKRCEHLLVCGKKGVEEDGKIKLEGVIRMFACI